MQFKITKKKVYHEGEQVPVGTIVDIDGDEIPGYLVNKGEVVEEAPAKVEKKTDSTDPAK